MSKWIIFYNFDGKSMWEVVEASNTMSAKEKMLNKHNTKAINIVDIDAYVPGMIELTDEEISYYRNNFAALIC